MIELSPKTRQAAAAAAVEYHASRQRRARHPSKRAPATPIEQEARLRLVFDRLAEVNRLSVATLVALGAEDHELAHECLGCLVADLREALRAWDTFRKGDPA